MIETELNIDIEGKLAARGILDAARKARWKPLTYTATGFPMAGWGYPVYNAGGQQYMHNGNTPVLRWKAADSSSKPKYAWLPKRPESARYYLLLDTPAAIRAANGTLYLASGEPDVLAYRAAGLHNSLCWFDGETSIPASLLDDLHYLHVTEIIYAPDLDETGMRAAAKLFQTLKGSDIELTMLRLHGEMGCKADINVLWQESGFDAKLFVAFLDDLPLLTEADYGMYLPAHSASVTMTALPLSADNSLYRAWIDEIVRALGAPAVREGHVDRWHCPTSRHADGDRHPSFRVAHRQGSPMPWPMCSCNIQDEERAWEIVADALHVESWREFKQRQQPIPTPHSNATSQQHQTAAQTPGEVAKSTGATAVEGPHYLISDDVYAQLRADLMGQTPPPEIEPVIFPFKLLHQFGGFAKIMFPGKLIAVLGISGGGKTSFGETCAENLIRDGYDVLWWGPEWSPYENALRSLQRQGGVTALDMARFNQWRADERAGIPANLRRGEPISDERRALSLAKLDEMAGWTGRIIYLDPLAKMDMSLLFDTVRAVVAERRAAGRKVAALFFDYLQLARKFISSSNAFWAEEAVSYLKSLVVECQLIGWVLTQPRKADSARTRDGDVLTEAAAQSLSDQQFNLYLTLTPSFDQDGKMLPWATIKVVKNSMGKTGNIQVQTDLSHLRWVEDEYRPKSQAERLAAVINHSPAGLPEPDALHPEVQVKVSQ